MKRTIKYIGYALVGYTLYWIPGFILLQVVSLICPPKLGFSTVCDGFWTVATVIVLLLSPFAVMRFHDDGKKFVFWIRNLTVA